MKFYALLTTLFLLCASALWAQERTISGTVRDGADRAPVIGANVTIKGTKQGTITDVNGNFKLRIPSDNAVLKVSFIGYQAAEMTVGNRSQVEVVLQADAEQLEEVVVTAFGIQQEKKALNYAVQQVTGAEIVNAQQPNVVNALQGKIAGVTITANGGAPGANSMIQIRGATSLSGDNQPLFVVDGVPISNATSNGGLNRAADINPNDVESISVLKGPAAAALYGIEGSNGAIIITTKAGKAGKSVVKVSSSAAFDQVGKLAPRQSMYTRGNSGLADSEAMSMWGPVFRPDQKYYDNLGEFFRTGVALTNDVSVSGGNDKTTFYLSASNYDQKGIVPSTALNKTSVLLKGNNKLNDRLSVGGSVNYIRTTNDRSVTDLYSGGSMITVMRWPSDHNMKDFEDDRGNKLWLFPGLVDYTKRSPGQSDNPYWTAKYNPVSDVSDRFLLNGNVQWQPIKGMNVTYRLGRDDSRTTHSRMVAYNSASTSGIPNILAMNGGILQEESNNTITTSLLTVSYNRALSESFRLTALAGHNLDMRTWRTLGAWGGPLLNPDLISLNNLDRTTITAQQKNQKRHLVGAFGELKLDYKGIAFVGVSGRNDWTSTLPTKNRSFFYPSVTTGIVVSELLPESTRKILSYAKLRGSYTEVGKDTGPNKLTPFLGVYSGPGGGFVNQAIAGNPELTPERTLNKEIGAEFKLFEGRFGIDFSYYDQISYDQIIQARITPTSGYIIQTFNSGDIGSKGYELMLEGMPIKTTNFTWDVTLNLSRVRSKLLALPGFLSEYLVAQSQVMGSANATSMVNQPLYGIGGFAYERTPEGRMVIDANGYPVRNPVRQYLGNRQADFSGGLTNTLRYKNLTLSFLIDFSKGADIMNATQSAMISQGTAKMLETYRNKPYMFDGVVKQADGFYVENNKEVVLTQSFFQNNYGLVGENFVEDVNWARLRYVSIAYNLPKNWVKRLGMSDLSVNVTGRNLYVLTNYSGGDPEVNSTGSNTGGVGTVNIDYFPVPLTKGVTVGFSATF